MANDKFRKMKLRPKAKHRAAQDGDAPTMGLKKTGKRPGNGRRAQGAE